MCLYDKNGIPCCTKNLDLVHGWFKKGWVKEDAHPMQAWLKFKKTPEDSVKWLFQRKWAMYPDQIYHLNSYTKKMMWRDKEMPQTRWNFECPTRHPVPPEPPVPKVAILLGNN